MTVYFICTVEEYEEGVSNGAKLDCDIRGYTPIYNHDKTMVLVTGYGDLTAEQVKQYQIENNWNGFDEVVI